MTKRKQPDKCRNIMYTQQVAHLPNGMSPDDLYSLVDAKLKPKRWAGILHDNDLKDDDVTPAEDNVHVMMQFDNARSLNQIAKEIGDAPQYIRKWNGDVSNGFAYLVHATRNARHKHQYSADEVRANFDYPKYLNRVMRKAAKVENISSSNKINGLLDLIGAGELSLRDAKNQLSGSVYAKNSQKLQKAHELSLERKAASLHNEMKESGELVTAHWFYGPTETGKTFVAEMLAARQGDYYKTTATRDPFQFYSGEPVIILDELRPDNIPYSELLALLNPFSSADVTISSRYSNKSLACKTFFITTPYEPRDFYYEYRLRGADRGEQLFRRLSSVLQFDENNIYEMEYDEYHGLFVIANQKPNPYSKKNQSSYALTSVFNEI